MLALASFFSILSRPGFATDVERLRRKGWPAPVPQPQLAPETAALQLLGLLQRETRLPKLGQGHGASVLALAEVEL